MPVKWDPNRQPVHVVVRLDDPLLYRCPVLFMEDVGTIGLSEAEVVSLRNYLLKGGFLWVDDFWGTPAWTCVGQRILASPSAGSSIRSSTSRFRTRSCTRCTT